MTNSFRQTVTAKGGGSGVANRAGSGWSGGGSGGLNLPEPDYSVCFSSFRVSQCSVGGGYGGYNGGDGELKSGTPKRNPGRAGKGQGIPLPTIKNVSIVPGAGGNGEYGESCLNWCMAGGGGGGIIINGGGKRKGGAQGYGAGAGYDGGHYHDNGRRAQSGAVVLYI